MSTRPSDPVHTILEEESGRDVPLFVHPGWFERFPWLFQGATGAGPRHEPFDLALFGDPRPAGVEERWGCIAEAAGFPRVAHSSQPHGSQVHMHDEGSPGFHLVPPGDGHVTRVPGVLLAVTVADCVPIYLVDPVQRAVALLHAGWRGAAAGILDNGLEILRDRMASRITDLYMHLGPAICGSCYEVGVEVFEALDLAAPRARGPLDLRAAIVTLAVGACVKEVRISVSSHCTRCEGSPFFSHRAGDSQRQAAVLGVRP